MTTMNHILMMPDGAFGTKSVRIEKCAYASDFQVATPIFILNGVTQIPFFIGSNEEGRLSHWVLSQTQTEMPTIRALDLNYGMWRLARAEDQAQVGFIGADCKQSPKSNPNNALISAKASPKENGIQIITGEKLTESGISFGLLLKHLAVDYQLPPLSLTGEGVSLLYTRVGDQSQPEKWRAVPVIQFTEQGSWVFYKDTNMLVKVS